MHPYTVKNYLWLAIIIMMVIIMCLTGCSSAPKQAMAPYCHTSQTVTVRDGQRVSSETTNECTDDQVKRVTSNRLGYASNCGEFLYWTKMGDRYVQRKGISCQKPNGTWEVINTSGS